MTIRWIRTLGALVLPMCLFATPPAAAQGGPEKVRGTLSAVEGAMLAVETGDGESQSYALGDEAAVFIATPTSLEEIKEGDFVGVTSVQQGDQRVALETHVFSEDLRGTGEGHYAWDLVQEPNMMTNATIAEVKEASGGRVLEVEYAANEETGSEAGSQTLMVPDDAPVVRLEKAADRSSLEAGKDVFVMVETTDGGEARAIAIVVGEGTSPPM